MPSLLAAVVTAMVSVVSAISYAAFIFSGDLTVHLGAGVALVLVSGLALRWVIALRTSFPLSHAGPQAAATAVLALIAASLAAALAASPPDEQLATIIATLAIATTITGVALYVLGRTGGERLVRFIPYPVIGGFLAGTGWLLTRGSVKVMVGLDLKWSTIRAGQFTTDVIARLWPGVLFALVVYLLQRWRKSPWILPAALLALLLLFYGYLLVAGLGIDEARARNLLLGPFPASAQYHPPLPDLWQHVNWSVVLAQATRIGSLVAIVALSISLTVTALETVTGSDVDLRQEFRASGVANIVAGLLGGVPGHHSPSESLLAWEMGARSRASAALSGFVFLIALALGPAFFSLLPRVLLGGLLLFLGVLFLSNWLVDGWRKLSRTDYLIVVVILVVIASVGFLEGVGIGMAIAVVLFVLDYSRVDAARRVRTGANARSNVARPPAHERALREHGAQILVVELQGYLFFGSASALRDSIRERFVADSESAPRTVIMDFALVSGLDSSSVMSFSRMRQLCEQHDARLVFTSMPDRMRPRFRAEGLLRDDADDAVLREFADLDRGLEWAEAQLLAALGMTASDDAATGDIATQLDELLREDGDVPDGVSGAAMLPFLQRQTLSAGEVLFEAGDPSGGMYFLESGRLSVMVATRRLRTFTGGTFVGEMGLYDAAPRSARVQADAPSTVFLLGRDDFVRMETDAPHLAARLHRVMVGVLSERLRHAQSSEHS
ncbi:MAG: SulP family inorganic anion transporter [Planctomycetota bacterium]